MVETLFECKQLPMQGLSSQFSGQSLGILKKKKNPEKLYIQLKTRAIRGHPTGSLAIAKGSEDLK